MLMKPMYRLLVFTALALPLMLFVASPMKAAIDETIANDVRLQTERLVSAINLISSAPEGAVYTVSMPNTKCKVLVTSGFVKMSIITATQGEINTTMGLVRSVPISRTEFDCKRSVTLTKQSGSLQIRTM